MQEKYASWKINGNSAYLDPINGPFVELRQGKDIPYEGCFGQIGVCRNVNSGICIFKGDWLVEFARECGNPAGRYSLALPMERQRAFKKIESGKKIKRIYCPKTLGTYHERLLAWQVQKFVSLNPGKILYHIPDLEYASYITALEKTLGLSLPSVYDSLRNFSRLIKERLLVLAEKFGLDCGRLDFIQPMELGAATPEESYLLPYANPELFGSNHFGLVGVEDLVELKLSVLAKEKTGISVPVICGVLGIPNPYIQKDLGKPEDYTIVELC